ncbi:MAG TPA: hypothetical protein VFB55_05300 [Verrucomicrobiae bacterium]|nr:hypothetical protein [Verrucomicrobiae bacterium]
MNSLTAMPLQQLKRAIAIREQIEVLTLELNDLMGISPLIPPMGNGHNARVGVAKPRGLSQAGRARIAAAQRLRWSRYNAGRPATEPSTTSERLSAEGRAKVSAAVKARWERYRAAKARSARSK